MDRLKTILRTLYGKPIPEIAAINAAVESHRLRLEQLEARQSETDDAIRRIAGNNV